MNKMGPKMVPCGIPQGYSVRDIGLGLVIGFALGLGMV